MAAGRNLWKTRTHNLSRMNLRALVPATPWLDDQPPPAPTLRRAGALVTIEPGAGEAAARWAVWRRVGGQVVNAAAGRYLQCKA